MRLPSTLCKEFILTAVTGGEKREILRVDNNRRRSFHVTFNGPVESITLVPVSNWGGSAFTRIFSFDYSLKN
jgi:hypothetical protein